MAPTAAMTLLDRCGDRLTLLHDVGREHASLAAAGVLACVNRARGNEERLARLHRPGRLAVDLERQRALENDAQLLAGVGVSADRPARLELGASLHRVATRDAEVAILHFDALESGLLRVQHSYARRKRGNGKSGSNRQFLHACLLL